MAQNSKKNFFHFYIFRDSSVIRRTPDKLQFYSVDTQATGISLKSVYAVYFLFTLVNHKLHNLEDLRNMFSDSRTSSLNQFCQPASFDYWITHNAFCR